MKSYKFGGLLPSYDNQYKIDPTNWDLSLYKTLWNSSYSSASICATLNKMELHSKLYFWKFWDLLPTLKPSFHLFLFFLIFNK